MTSIVYVDGDDWVGLYVDGSLKHEGHSIAAEKLLQIGVENPGATVERKYADIDWLMDLGNFPLTLDEVKFV